MAKSKNTEQEGTGEANGQVLKPNFMWVHHSGREIQRQIKKGGPGFEKLMASYTKAGFKPGPLGKTSKPTPPVEAETI